MGTVGLPIYGMKDKFSSLIMHLVVVPNDRRSSTIGHVYLDYLDKYRSELQHLRVIVVVMYYIQSEAHTHPTAEFPLQITVDKGSETGEMYALHTALR